MTDMRSNLEFRSAAWDRLFKGRWFWKVFGGGLLLGLCGSAVQIVIRGVLGRLGVMDVEAYQEARIAAVTSGIAAPELTGSLVFQLASSSCLEWFFSVIMGGIAAYGGSVILLKCLANDERDWLRDAFGGFWRPLEMAWLLLRQILIFAGWTVLALIPCAVVCGFVFPPCLRGGNPWGPVVAGVTVSVLMLVAILVMCVPFYRYRFLWLVKAEHPDWTAGECLSSCKAMMDGHKRESFRLDCAYWRPITLFLLLLLLVAFLVTAGVELKDTSTALSAICAVGCIFAAFACLAIALVLGPYIGVGQAFFYQDLKDGQPTE